MDKGWSALAARPFDPYLTELGRQQARAVSADLKRFDLKRVYVSPFLRRAPPTPPVPLVSGFRALDPRVRTSSVMGPGAPLHLQRQLCILLIPGTRAGMRFSVGPMHLHRCIQTNLLCQEGLGLPPEAWTVDCSVCEVAPLSPELLKAGPNAGCTRCPTVQSISQGLMCVTRGGAGGSGFGSSSVATRRVLPSAGSPVLSIGSPIKLCRLHNRVSDHLLLRAVDAPVCAVPRPLHHGQDGRQAASRPDQ